MIVKLSDLLEKILWGAKKVNTSRERQVQSTGRAKIIQYYKLTGGNALRLMADLSSIGLLLGRDFISLLCLRIFVDLDEILRNWQYPSLPIPCIFEESYLGCMNTNILGWPP